MDSRNRPNASTQLGMFWNMVTTPSDWRFMGHIVVWNSWHNRGSSPAMPMTPCMMVVLVVVVVVTVMVMARVIPIAERAPENWKARTVASMSMLSPPFGASIADLRH